MRRGEILWVDFEPSIGVEADKRRPAIVVSNDGANTRATSLARGVIAVVPITSNTSRVLPFQVLLKARRTGLACDSKAQTELLRAVSFERLGDRIGVLQTPELTALDDALRLHLAL